MSSTIYPLHFEQKFERRWASRMVRDEPRRSPSHGTNTCICGHLITAPIRSTYSPTGVVNKWRCSACGNHWETIADPGAASTKPNQ
ncbi:hypothetical protein [Bradyrhizobium cenepequi]|uniref:hypothetical protein n=1 Tax=Bradyrhizobium cenepequi TaxID=2821403 RepID=UPI001CE36C73|nr:hypothetical protein [Bradyrhizobium cenepequi]MCA6110518.1 hypothetical protein [Bradyrhizobium cenepequi]